MLKVDQLICARWIVPIAPQNIVLEHHAVAIRGGKIVDCLPIDSATQQYEATETIKLDQHALMPGLVNTHTHDPMTLFRGLADDLPLMDWLNNYIWPAEKNIICSESVTDGCNLAFAEMIRGGTTCFNEHYFFPLETAEAAINNGLRGCIGNVIMNVPNDWATDEDGYIAKAKEVLNNKPEHELLSWSIAPHAPYTNSDSSLSKAKQLADDFDLIMHMHLHETDVEVNIDLEKYAKRPIRRLHDLGLLDEKFLAVHMVHTNDEDIDIIKQTKTNIVHCPESNLKLASGFAPIQRYLNEGINIALGTDGAASNNDLDMFSELRTASFIAKALTTDPTALPAAKALELATMGGAKALGLDNKIGSIEAGKFADIIAVDLGQFITQPVYNPISHLAYAVNRLQVSDVWVAGKRLLKDKQFTHIDINGVMSKINKWASKADKYKSEASTMTTVY